MTNNDSVTYPPVAFSFEVLVQGTTANDVSSFAEVSGLDAEMTIETIQEGGENRFPHRIPARVYHPNLVLKRGIVNVKGQLASWCREVLEGGIATPVVPKDIEVNLLKPNGTPSMSWLVKQAWPVKWSISTLDAHNNSLAIDVIEFSYRELNRRIVNATV